MTEVDKATKTPVCLITGNHQSIQQLQNIILKADVLFQGSPLFDALAKYEALVPSIPQSSMTDLNQNNNASTAQL